MFESDLAALDAHAVGDLVAESYRQLVHRETRLLVLAAHWADLHGWEESLEPTAVQLPGVERARQVGGAGTPWVLEFAAAELGALQQTTTNAAFAQMADALDLRHRLPRLWARVLAGEVRAWKARRVAQETRHLTEEAAAFVDAAVTPFVVSVPWGRFQRLLQAKIIESDPADAEQQRKLWETERFVRTGQSCQHGLKVLVARANAGDVIWFMAMVNRIADLLLLDGDADSADVRRSKAIGILAQPAVALQLLMAHQGDLDGRDDEEPGAVAEALDRLPEVEPTDHRSVLMPAGERVDPARLRPPAVLYVHVSEQSFHRDGAGVARFEDAGPVTVDQARRFLGEHCNVRIQPVIDVANEPSADRYEVPDRLREAVLLRTPAEVFPFGTSTSRRMDLDHTTPYLSAERGGHKGQTSLSNLGPLSRHHHRVKTHGRWGVRQPSPGTFVWRSPTGQLFVVTATGTLPLGRTAFSDSVWRNSATQVEAPSVAA